MSSRIKITSKNIEDYFYLKKLVPEKPPVSFICRITEYNDYLFQDAIRSLKDHIAKTWLLREQKTGEIAAYMSLIMDAIKLSFTEKELHNLDYPFKTIPAMKIAKLAVDTGFSQRFKGIGSFMINAAMGKIIGCNEDYCAARFLTVDADIEHDKGVLAFYEKNGFVPNSELSNKNRKTISMRKDVYK
jgi:GNAT superfamily N-acetyltransferase